MAKSERIRTIGMVPDLPSITVPPNGQLSAIHMTYLLDTIRTLIAVVNGGISFGDGQNSSYSGNIDGQLKIVNFANSNTDYEVPHGLGRVPLGIIPLLVAADGAVVRGASNGSWTSERLFVRCNVAGTTALFVVI